MIEEDSYIAWGYALKKELPKKQPSEIVYYTSP